MSWMIHSSYQYLTSTTNIRCPIELRLGLNNINNAISTFSVLSVDVFSLYYFVVVNHKSIGLYYLLATFLFGLSGTILSVLMRIELDSSGNRIIPIENLNFYNLTITLHGLLMIFFLIMPGLFGAFGNIFIPIILGTPEVAYPSVNNMSILLIPLAYE